MKYFKTFFNLPITIKQNVFFDYLYIKDFFKILDYFLNHTPKYFVYNVGRGKKVDLLSIAKKIKKISGKNLSIQIAKKGLKNQYTCDISRLKKEMKTLEFTDFDQSLKEMFVYYKKIYPTLLKKSFLTDI